jgi:hypothetical protein
LLLVDCGVIVADIPVVTKEALAVVI